MDEKSLTEPTREDVSKLVDAMWQILDDMGKTGTSACVAAKAQARIAIEPFSKGDFACPVDFDDWMSLEEARHIIAECER